MDANEKADKDRAEWRREQQERELEEVKLKLEISENWHKVKDLLHAETAKRLESASIQIDDLDAEVERLNNIVLYRPDNGR